MNYSASMRNVQPLVTLKYLEQQADLFIRESIGRFSKKDMYEHLLLLAMQANNQVLIEETARSIAHRSFERHTKTTIANNKDWIGYGDLLLGLGNGLGVLARNAETADLGKRATHVRMNLRNVAAAALIELNRIHTIQTIMEDQCFRIAHPALEWLQNHRNDTHCKFNA